MVPVQDASRTNGALIEYSAREVCPSALILAQLLRAHQIFLLHQAPSIAQLFDRVSRTRFCGLLKRFWDDFIWNWDVLLHGNPGVDIFNGIKLAAGGELGIGVGEEEWGSGERDVLEGFVERTEGLVDLVVSRFGDTPPSHPPSSPASPSKSSSQVPGLEQIPTPCPRPSDGIVFSGVGALDRHTVRDISSWVEWLHVYRQGAYGVRDNPSSIPRQKRRRAREAITQKFPSRIESGSGNIQQRRSTPAGRADNPASIPRPLIVPQKDPSKGNNGSKAATREASTAAEIRDIAKPTTDPSSTTETFMKYLTLGVYGSAWGIPAGRPLPHQQSPKLSVEDNKANSRSTPQGDDNYVSASTQATGYFLVGLQGDVEEPVKVESSDLDTESGADSEVINEDQGANARVLMRTLHVKRFRSTSLDRNKEPPNTVSAAAEEDVFSDRVRVIVYINSPFIFTLLFDSQTAALAMPSFYRSLHHQLGPLQRPLLASTSPSRVSERLWEAVAPKSTAAFRNSQPVYDLVFDPARLTVHTTIPNIPEPGVSQQDSVNPLPWTRVEALSVHLQILSTYTSTRQHPSELERTCKTSRGWWVVWVNVPHAPLSNDPSGSKYSHEAFLIRKASDYIRAETRKSSNGSPSDGSGFGVSGGWGPGKLVEGIGIDARQYIDGLLSLNR